MCFMWMDLVELWKAVTAASEMLFTYWVGLGSGEIVGKKTSDRRCSISVHTCCLAVSFMALQATISSMVRQQPAHRPLGMSIWHSEMQGEGTEVIFRGG